MSSLESSATRTRSQSREEQDLHINLTTETRIERPAKILLTWIA